MHPVRGAGERKAQIARDYGISRDIVQNASFVGTLKMTN